MSTLTDQEQAANLRAFFAEGVNSVTRERIFFNRLAFDLKIAAARAGYHLHLYEPDVDRDGFDIVVEDQDDGMGWFQLKAVLRSAETGGWDTTVGFLRPHIDIGDQLGFDPAECGRGGGVILIEIDDTTDRGDVVYSYTDFRILAALAERYLVEDVPPGKRKQGRPKTTRQAVAAGVIKAIRTGRRAATVTIPRAAFVEVRTPDALLALMALTSHEEFAPFAIQQAYSNGVTIDALGTGVVRDDRSIDALGNLRHHMEALARLLQGQPGLKSFAFTSPYAGTTRQI